MKKAIEISVLRVSSNGKYIEFIINCPRDYYFTDFVINVYGHDDKYSLKESLFVADPEDEDAILNEYDELYYHNKHYYSGQFKVEDINVDRPEMYEVKLEAFHNELADSDLEDEMEVDECWTPPVSITSYAVISDVSKVYSCLMHDILNMGNGKDICVDSKASDELIRNYLILYAHQEAMKLRELQDAKKYFDMLNKCFTLCGEHKTPCSVCSGGTLLDPSRFNTYKPSSCGCGR